MGLEGPMVYQELDTVTSVRTSNSLDGANICPLRSPIEGSWSGWTWDSVRAGNIRLLTG